MPMSLLYKMHIEQTVYMPLCQAVGVFVHTPVRMSRFEKHWIDFN
jgi:hypothetical protein